MKLYKRSIPNFLTVKHPEITKFPHMDDDNDVWLDGSNYLSVRSICIYSNESPLASDHEIELYKRIKLAKKIKQYC